MSAFISYSRANSDFAVRLAKDLKSAGYDVWLDQLNIPTGTRWDDAIETALEACTTFMIILSPDSMQSQNVKDEIGYAIDTGKYILPVKIKSGDIPFRLKRFQYVDFTDKPYEESLKEIKSLLAMTGQLLAGKVAEKRPARAESQPAVEKAQPLNPPPIAQAKKPTSKRPAAIGSPVKKTPISKGLIIGMVAVVPLVIAAIIISAIRANKAPVITPTSGAPVVENPLTEQPTAEPTVDTTQVSTQAGQPEIFLTNFLDSKELENWENIYEGTGKSSQATTQLNDGLVFKLEDRDLRAYYFYKPVIYEDVIIRVKTENLGQNTYTVSMVCRRNGDTWYEFSITASSLWQLYDYRGEYDSVDNGGTMAGKSGKAVNEYEMRCIGDEISLHVNGQPVETFKFNAPRNRYPEGQVGFGISSEDVFPIDIKVIEFEVSNAPSGSSAVDSASTPVVAGIADTPLPDAASENEETFVSSKDGMAMVFVPAGEFTMGTKAEDALAECQKLNTDCQLVWFKNQEPAHQVFLDAFWIDRTEITNRMFATFLNSQAANSDAASGWLDVGDEDLHIDFVNNSWQVDLGFEDHPAIEMKWFGASAYCEWRGDGTRLPTEAEWEKAARGTTENLYPWGNQIDCNLANYGECVGGTVEVGSYLSNASPYSALDMTGNVMEWVADWYAEGYYQSSPSSNPLGPDSGQHHVLRGGSWDGHTEYQVRPTFRFIEAPDESKDDAGFRCVMPE